MTTKTLGLLLLPLVPLSALGVIEVAGRLSRPDVEITTCTAAPAIEEHVQPRQRFAKPPAPSPAPAPQPAPVA
jgi:hypothetical protein